MARKKSHERVVADALYEAVERAGGTQTALAEKLGCSRQNVNLMIQRGRVTIERARQIERLLGVPRQRLIPQAFE